MNSYQVNPYLILINGERTDEEITIVGAYQPITSEFISFSPGQLRFFHHIQAGRRVAQSQSLDYLITNNVVKDQNGKRSWSCDLSTPDDEMEVYIETTQGCNFRCTGCASGVDQRFGQKVDSLNSEKLAVFLEKLFVSASKRQMKTIRIKWAGGEPLIVQGSRHIAESQPLIERLKRKYSLSVFQILLTNGSLLSRNIQFVQEVGMDHVSVSLWGLGLENDRLRNTVAGTYQKIIDGLHKLHDLGISFNVNHVVTPFNADRFADFLDAFWNVESSNYNARGWEWKSNPKPIPVGINFFRPQQLNQTEYLNTIGYQKMVTGFKNGLTLVRQLIKSGIPI